jgi:hypothetical protein
MIGDKKLFLGMSQYDCQALFASLQRLRLLTDNGIGLLFDFLVGNNELIIDR